MFITESQRKYHPFHPILPPPPPYFAKAKAILLHEMSFCLVWPYTKEIDLRNLVLRKRMLDQKAPWYIPWAFILVSYSVVPNLFGTRDRFHGRQFFHGPEGGGWFRDDSSILHSSSLPAVQPGSSQAQTSLCLWSGGCGALPYMTVKNQDLSYKCK